MDQVQLFNSLSNETQHSANQSTDGVSLTTSFSPLDLYLVLSHFTLGLLLNLILFISVLTSLRQSAHASATAHRAALYSSASSKSPPPVVDQIVAILGAISLLRLIIRSAPMVGCFYGFCFTAAPICYLQGFLNTFLHHIHLWTMALFLQDRYIAHHDPSSYLSKCSHFVLYVTLIGVTFLTSMHFCAPIYGFSAYRFVSEELTCTIDWLSHYSCPYWVYSFLLVAGPAYLPLFYWTLRLTYKRIVSLPLFRPASPTVASICPIEIDQAASSAPRHRSPITSLLHSKPVHLLLPCCVSTKRIEHSVQAVNSFEMQTTVTSATQARESSSSDSSNGSKGSKKHRRYRKNTTPTATVNGRKTTYKRPSSTTSSERNIYISPTMLGTGSGLSISHHSRSNVLTQSNELASLLLCSWIFLLSYAPKLLANGCRACFLPSNYPVITDEAPNPPPILVSARSSEPFHNATFYLAILDETAACVLLPLLLLAFHSKLRFSVIVMLACLLTFCRVPCRRIRFNGVPSRTSQRRGSTRSNRTSRLPGPGPPRPSIVSTASSRLGKAAGISIRISAEPTSFTSATSDHSIVVTSQATGSPINRSSSLRINYPSHSAKANHYQSERNIAITVI